MPLLRSAWTPGPAHAHPGPVLVSLTDLTLPRRLDLPGVYRAARRLTAGWPDLEGAVGVWLWASPGARRCGAVAVWRDEAALRGFVAWPPHVDVMRRYRGRGALSSATWTAPRCDPSGIRARARASISLQRKAS
ncbi:hypothetical protein [Streptomyces natalensis]|uniref:hypothetical protein n=1 Tax=Streptomyces natalensis TaxID=68242 RepID=UPI0005C9BC0C|nr:hypothetical protein [Streptomyces natalensis]